MTVPVPPFRELFMPTYAYDVMYAMFLVAALVMLYGLYSHLRHYGIGLRQFLRLVFTKFSTKVKRFVKYGLAQFKVLNTESGGIMHGAIFFGIFMLAIYTTIVFIQDDFIGRLFGIVFVQGSFYLTLEFLGDVFGIAFVIGLAIALYRRYVMHLEQLETSWDDNFVIGMLLWIGVSGFVLEALRFVCAGVTCALQNGSYWQYAVYSPVGSSLGALFSDAGLNAAGAWDAYQVFWWAHMVSVMVLIAVLPWTKLIHVFTAGANVAMAPVEPMGKLSTPFNLQKMLESGEVEAPPNLKKSTDFTPLQLLALDACTNCGRCQAVCPAYASGRDLSPRLVVQDLCGDMRAGDGGDVFSKGVIRDAELWACTMCNACVNECPVLIDQVDYIAEFRRTLVSESRLDPKKKSFLENVGRNGNPFGLPASDRQTWLEEIGVPTLSQNPKAEYLYWVGCQSSYDPRGKSVAQSMVKILKAANVDFAVLGNEETCTGEPVRRMGEEGRFQELLMHNAEAFGSHGVKKVIVHCPHCFNTFKNEYPEFGVDVEVIHHSQLIAKLIAEGRITPGPYSGKVTYHDPCNLGRINGVFDEPREVLGSMKGIQLSEMKRARMNGFCCGGGGANVWYEVPEKKKVGIIRAEEAVATGAETLAVACPFCITMFDDALKAMGNENMRIKDIAEIVADSLAEKK
jgi:Fe-S oxidoreductase/nitrate reductase gamma subunit